MTETGPSVALLFDDTELVAQLREALRECGARIVHEGGLASLDQQLLRELDADVLVINLDAAAAEALDPLYALIDDDRPRIVFNDAEASAALTGWDRARWARHLAVKIFQMGDIDPPRPADARSVEVPTVEPGEAPAAAQDEEQPVMADMHANGTDAPDAGEDAGAAQRSLVETKALSEELEALLASAELLDGDASDPTGDAGLFAPDGSELATAEPPPDAGIDLPPAEPPVAPSVLPPALAVMGVDDLLDMLPAGVELPPDSSSVPAHPTALPNVPTEWALVDDDDVTPATFGVEKQSAADFLAPDAADMAVDDEPVLNMELVSMEEAIAPRPAQAAVEMHLDELQMALSRLVLTGATLGGTGAALAFYAALPVTTQLTFLHTQHLRGQSAVDLVRQLASACKLAVTLAVDGVPARPGEILVVPPGHRVRIRRDAGVELQTWEDELQEPSIDDSFRMAAEIFGRDALAIVFSGHSTDSIAGAKAIHAAGGQVWIETAAPEYADVVHEVSGAVVVDYSGTPEEMAAHLPEKLA